MNGCYGCVICVLCAITVVAAPIGAVFGVTALAGLW